MGKFKILTIVSLVVATAIAAYWTQFYFDARPMELRNVDDGSIDWPYVILVFTFPFVAVFCGGVFIGSIPLVVVKLFGWLKRRLAGARPPDDGPKLEG